MESNGLIRFTRNLGKCYIYEFPLTFDADSDEETMDDEDREASEEEDGDSSQENGEEASEEEVGEVFEDPHEPQNFLLAWLLVYFFERREYQIMYSEDPTSQPIGFAAPDEPYVESCYTAFLCETKWANISALSNE